VHEYMDGGGGRKAANFVFLAGARRWPEHRQCWRRRGRERDSR
jgi:hypothetical protein